MAAGATGQIGGTRRAAAGGAGWDVAGGGVTARGAQAASSDSRKCKPKA